MEINNKDYYIIHFDKARKALLDFFLSIDGSCRLVRVDIGNKHKYLIEGEELVFEFNGIMVKMDENKKLEFANENTNIKNHYMAIPKEIFLDTERFITIKDFSERNRLIKMHIMKMSLPMIMEYMMPEKAKILTTDEVKQEIKNAQKIINDEKKKIKLLKKELAKIKENEEVNEKC